MSNKNLTVITGTGLLAGFLDGSAAIVQYLIKGGQHPEKIFQYIASAVFGKESYAGGNTTIIWGVVFHFIIAMLFTVAFYFLYPSLKKMFTSKLLIAFVYGILVWMAMNLAVVPLTKIGTFPADVKGAVIAALVLIFMIGLPNALIIGSYLDRSRDDV